MLKGCISSSEQKHSCMLQDLIQLDLREMDYICKYSNESGFYEEFMSQSRYS